MSRAALAPPTNFFTLEDGNPVLQCPLDRTRNKISKPEVVAHGADPLGTAEQRLLTEMGIEKGVSHAEKSN